MNEKDKYFLLRKTEGTLKKRFPKKRIFLFFLLNDEITKMKTFFHMASFFLNLKLN